MPTIVKVYRNLHKGCWSIKQGGLVVAHAEEVHLANVKMVVKETGRQKVLQSKTKNVHAYLTGELTGWVGTAYKGRMLDHQHERPACTNPPTGSGVCTISYNPYKAGHFVQRSCGPVSHDQPIFEAGAVVLSASGKVYGIA